METIKVIGGGLSGSEAALQLAKLGYNVKLYEMRSVQSTPAHKTTQLAELVCSNSFKGLGESSAHGLFKKELQILGSELMKCAFESRVEAGESLTVDRDVFSARVMAEIAKYPNIELIREEVTEINEDEWTLVAAGPLCSDALAQFILNKTGSTRLHFFDAIAPVVDADSVDMNFAYFKNRWDKGETQDFLNCPLDKETYHAFVKALAEADAVEAKPFEKKELFEGCLPIEEMAVRGPETLSHGPMRPVGLFPEGFTKETKPYAVIQLRAENKQKTLYNMVGFQTRLKWGTQTQIFKMVPALKNATFARLGCMHRNTFIETPKLLNKYFRLKDTKIFFAGQILGAEGYTEAVGTGLYSAWQIAHHIQKDCGIDFPEATCLGALSDFLTSPNESFQPMNFNFGLLPKTEEVHRKEKKSFLVEQTLKTLQEWKRPF